MLIDVVVPPVGESITEGVLAEWLKPDGEVAAFDEPLFSLETDKITMTVNAPAAGRLAAKVAAGETVTIGQVVATIDDAAAAAAGAPPRPAAPPAQAEPPAAAKPPVLPGEPATPPQTPGPPLVTPAGLPQAREKLGPRLDELSPATRRVVAELGLDPAGVPGTGKGGRLTKEDVLKAAAAAPAPAATPPPAAATPPPAAAAPPPAAPAAPAPAGAPAPTPAALAPAGERQTRTPMTPLRQRIAERLLQAKNQTAMLTTFNEVDMTNVMALRAQHREAFKARHGVDLGFMSFFVRAVVDALKAVPEMNSQLQGNELVRNHYYDIGIAVSSEKGLVVPVLRDADRLTSAGIEQGIADLARRVRDRTITLAELSGGVFSITNGGVYGNLMSTPILNPPQAGILGMHAIKKRPVADGDRVVVRPMMYLAVSYDHRIVDGREAVTFLKRVVAAVENPGFLLLDL